MGLPRLSSNKDAVSLVGVFQILLLLVAYDGSGGTDRRCHAFRTERVRTYDWTTRRRPKPQQRHRPPPFLLDDHHIPRSRTTTTRTTTAALLSSSSSSQSQPSQQQQQQRQQPKYYQVTFEYCTGCKWGLRSFYMAQELLTTFRDAPELVGVTLLPTSNPKGTFTVKCHDVSGIELPVWVWDRTRDGGFPETKVLKQKIRDVVQPTKYLGHSDTAESQSQHHGETIREEAAAEDATEATCEECSKDDGETVDNDSTTTATTTMISHGDGTSPESMIVFASPHIGIAYCTGCSWLYRAAWYGQELLLSTFAQGEIMALSLLPSRPSGGAGIGPAAEPAAFTVTLNDDDVLWDRKQRGRFPHLTEIQQIVRDKIAPSKPLGHVDAVATTATAAAATDEDALDDDDADEARKFFGVA